MGKIEAATVRKQIVVDAPIERAFEVFTDRFGDFKPPEHNMLGAPITQTVFEPWVGGSIVDRASDGSECRWARILAFDPPDRVVFSWDISPAVDYRDRPGEHQRGRGPVLRRIARPHAGRAGAPEHRPAWSRMGSSV